MRHLGYLRSLLRGVGVRKSLSQSEGGVPDICAYHTPAPSRGVWGGYAELGYPISAWTAQHSTRAHLERISCLIPKEDNAKTG